MKSKNINLFYFEKVLGILLLRFCITRYFGLTILILLLLLLLFEKFNSVNKSVITHGYIDVKLEGENFYLFIYIIWLRLRFCNNF